MKDYFPFPFPLLSRRLGDHITKPTVVAYPSEGRRPIGLITLKRSGHRLGEHHAAQVGVHRIILIDVFTYLSGIIKSGYREVESSKQFVLGKQLIWDYRRCV